MNEVLLRPIFRAKYMAEQLNKNKFKKGGLATLKLQQGGMSDKQLAMLAALSAGLTTGSDVRPGEPEVVGLTRGLGKGLAMFPGILKEGKPQTVIKTGEPKESEFSKQLAKKDAEFLEEQTNLSTSAENQNQNLSIIEALADNPDLTVGQFGPLSTSVERFAQGLGFTTGVQDLKAAELLQNVSGGLVLEGLSNFKGAISNAEREYVASLNPGLTMSKDGIRAIVELTRRKNNRQKQFTNAMDRWVNNYGSLRAKAPNGDNFFTWKEKWLNANPILDNEIKQRITRATKKIDKGFRNPVFTGKDGKQYIKIRNEIYEYKGF